MKKIYFKLLIFVLILSSLHTLAYAVNDVNLTSDTNFIIETSDTAALTTIVGQNGSIATHLDVQTNYIDVTLDNGSDITFQTDGSVYFNVTSRAGTGFTFTPNCPPTTTTTLTSTANAVLRVQVTEAITECPACNDGVDNDADGQTDLAEDPGCLTLEDNNEENPTWLDAELDGEPGGGPFLAPGEEGEGEEGEGEEGEGEEGEGEEGEGEDHVTFTDIEGHWAEPAIIEMLEQGYFDRYGDTFSPDQYITRAEVSELTALWLNSSITDADCNPAAFTDVTCSVWYGKYISYLFLKQIVEGYGDGTFRPNNNITRAEALKIIVYAKLLQNIDLTGFSIPFLDVDPNAWYYNVILIGYGLNIIEGYNDNTFRPNDPVTRAEFVQMFVDSLL